jgi:hypothetical protein
VLCVRVLTRAQTIDLALTVRIARLPKRSPGLYAYQGKPTLRPMALAIGV